MVVGGCFAGANGARRQEAGKKTVRPLDIPVPVT